MVENDRPGGLSRRVFLNGAVAAGCVGCAEDSSSPPGGDDPQASSSDASGGPATGDEGGSSVTGQGSGSTTGPTGEDDSSTTGDQGTKLLNVLFITADDMGWKSLESHGAIEHCRHLNELASASKVFPLAFNVTSSCSSSRASFATGQYPSQHGVTGLVHRHPELSLPPVSSTLARTLQEAGYVTGIAGKFHISDVEPAEEFGYDDVGPKTLKDNEFVGEFLAAHAEEPFYLELNYKQTHRTGSPRSFPIDENFPVSAEDVFVPEYWALPDLPEIRESVAGYVSQVCAMDDLIGGVLALLDRHSLRNQTLIMFVSDNGVSYPGNKTMLYDRGIGSPCILWDPRTGATGTQSGLVSSIDYAPTLLEAAGLYDPSLAGVPLTLPLPRRDAVFAEMFWHASEIGIRSIRTRRWKFIANTSVEPIGSGEVSDLWEQELEYRPWAEERVPFELYDLEVDPHEQTNLFDAEPDVAAELYARLLEHTQTTGDTRSLPPLPDE